MPSFNPFSLGGAKAPTCTLFDIRLENDFIVFRGNEHEASGQLLKGTVVLCLSSPLSIQNVHLKLTGTLHYGYGLRQNTAARHKPLTFLPSSWTDSRVTPGGIAANHRIDKTIDFMTHRWRPFIGYGAEGHTAGDSFYSKGQTLQPGNYEWPFQLMLSGDTTESVEGLREASITYKLKATVARGKMAKDLHAYKRLRIIRTLDSSALEILHAMSVENIWPNKIEYSIVVPQKAVVFGSCIPLETRFTPLLKGLELGDINVRLIEIHDILLHNGSGHSVREHKKEREIEQWKIPVNREEHWQNMIEDTGQEGWVLNTSLNLPKKLAKCLQDVNVKGIKIRHKLKLIVALKNPDGHVSELRATLPVSIFISPNMPLDEDGNLVRQLPSGTTSQQVAAIAPPGYGEHVLDQLYEDMETLALQTPAGGRSLVGSPVYGRSRASSAENLTALYQNQVAANPNHSAQHAAQLTHRLQSSLLSQHNRNHSWQSFRSIGSMGTGAMTPLHPPEEDQHSPPQSVPLTRQNSDENSPGTQSPEHIDYLELNVLSKVPSYQTAVKTPVKPLTSFALPDYTTAMSVPGTPQRSPPTSPQLGTAELRPTSDGTALGSIAEVPTEVNTQDLTMSPPRTGRRTSPRRRQFSLGALTQIHGEGDEHRRLHLMRAQQA
ncbi:hypothetical protein QBC35DRAFT_376850 [Podospora australis]|uniref:Arrestin C-terminal-like domain-containing protein n=1 Tax=Podospora australis TaxID=1536484 RepID=A0AAN7AJF5_9PEZI|nr:hypothetical protein QBC35DRAFT_376850 [Podospora australis]